jgi:hypothetical protein
MFFFSILEKRIKIKIIIQQTNLPHSRKVPGAAITRSGLEGILNLDLVLVGGGCTKGVVVPQAKKAVTGLNGFAFIVLLPKLRILVT